MKKFSRRRFLKMLGLSPVIAKVKPDILTEILEEKERIDSDLLESDEVVAWVPSPYFCDSGISIRNAVTAAWGEPGAKWECPRCGHENPCTEFVCGWCTLDQITDRQRTIWS